MQTVYEKVGEDEDVDCVACQHRQPRQRFSRGTVLVANLALLTIAFVLFLATVVTGLDRKNAPARVGTISAGRGHGNHDNAAARGEECGHTAKEAIDNGCRLDIMSNLWTPALCFDEAFANDTLNGVTAGANEFGLDEFWWYEDEELTRPLTVDSLEVFLQQQARNDLPLEAFAPRSFHAAHCSYLSRVGARGLQRLIDGETDVWVPEPSATLEHARHCEHVFGEIFRQDRDRQWTQVGFGYAPCIRIG